MGALQTFEASLRHAVRERQAATVGGGYFTYQELEKVLGEIMALRAEVAALSVNAHDDYRAIERKDALLRRAREALGETRVNPEDYDFGPAYEGAKRRRHEVLMAIKQELSQ